MSNPNRGEVWLVDLGYVAKVRPCLVISIPVLEKERALVTLIAHTTSIQETRFEVPIKARFLRTGVFDVQNTITVSQAKLIKKLGVLKPEELSAIEEVIKLWLGFEG
jgi:mRNA interferase MazF